MIRLVFGTANEHKLSEVRDLLGSNVDVIAPGDVGFYLSIPETQETLSGNAVQKAQFLHEHIQENCFAEDTGLEVKALDGAPGVYSARYASHTGKENKEQITPSSAGNMDLLLSNMEGKGNRVARFRTIVCLIFNGREYLFEGQLNGMINEEKSGREGFGYDPIFQPDGFDMTLAEMTIEMKNKISHRADAFQKLLVFLKERTLM